MVADFLIPRLMVVFLFSIIFIGLTYYIAFKKKFDFGKFLQIFLIINILFTFFSRWEGGWGPAAITIALRIVLVLDFLILLILKFKK